MADHHAPASVLHLLNECNRRLEHLLDNLRNERDAEGALRAIAAEVVHAVAQQPCRSSFRRWGPHLPWCFWMR